MPHFHNALILNELYRVTKRNRAYRRQFVLLQTRLFAV